MHRQLEGLGYVPPFAGSKQLRDGESGVRVEFLVTGAFPGDGKPKAVAFPDPSTCRVEIDGVQCLTLAKLVELKLASGISTPYRAKDLVDAQSLIESLHLTRDFAEQLDPSVQPKYLELKQIIEDLGDQLNNSESPL